MGYVDRALLRHTSCCVIATYCACDPSHNTRSMAGRLPKPIQTRLKGRGKDAKPGRSAWSGWHDVAERLINQQLRNAYYSCDRGREILGYEPVVSFTESSDAFRRWYQAHSGFGTDNWNLVSDLYSPVA